MKMTLLWLPQRSLVQCNLVRKRSIRWQRCSLLRAALDRARQLLAASAPSRTLASKDRSHLLERPEVADRGEEVVMSSPDSW